jgi:hypothetical protein
MASRWLRYAAGVPTYTLKGGAAGTEPGPSTEAAELPDAAADNALSPSLAICGACGVGIMPELTGITSQGKAAVTIRTTADTCKTSSWFGSKITAKSPPVPPLFAADAAAAATGRTYSMVFPEPVSAATTADDPFSTVGSARAWISLARVSPIARRLPANCVGRCKSANVFELRKVVRLAAGELEREGWGADPNARTDAATAARRQIDAAVVVLNAGAAAMRLRRVAMCRSIVVFSCQRVASREHARSVVRLGREL